MRPISHRTLIRKSRNWRNFQAMKSMANHLEKKFGCPIYSDKTELNKLDFTPTPEIPKVQVEKVEFPQWVKQIVKGSLGQLIP